MFLLFIVVSSLSNVVQIAGGDSKNISQTRVVQAIQETEPSNYEEYKEHIHDIVISQNPRVALQKASKDTAMYDFVAKNCHLLGHDIGHFALQKYEDLAQVMKYDYSLCGSSYLHGVITELFEQSETTDPIQLSHEICPDNNPFCIHGIGHGFMYYTDYNVDDAIALCRKLPQAYQIFCAEGIFMEKYDGPEVQLGILSENDTCSKYSDEYKGACNYYQGRAFHTLSEPIQECADRSTVDNEKLSFVRGYGSGVIRDNPENPVNILQECGKASAAELQNSCLIGAINYYRYIQKETGVLDSSFCLMFEDATLKNLCLSDDDATSVLGTFILL